MQLNKSISIIILTYNSEKFIQNCINSIYQSHADFLYEIIIVDNNSQDNTVNIIKEKYSQANLIENRNNLGFAKANNRALKIAKGKYALLLNPDTEISVDTLDKFYNFMENENNKNVWCIGGQLVDEFGQPSKSYGRFPNMFDVFFEQSGLKGIALKIFGKNWLLRIRWIEKSKKVPFVMGCNMFIRKDVLMKIGYFNESFFLNYEEVELCWKAEKKEFISVVLPEVIIKHYSGKSFESRQDYLNHLWLSQVLFFKLTRSRFYYGTIKALHLIGALLRYTLKFDKNYLDQIKKVLAI